MSDIEEDTNPAVPHPSPVARFDLTTLAGIHGQLAMHVVDGDKFSARHEVAAVNHGWNLHQKHYGPLLLTVDEYLSALDAAPGTFPAADRRR